MKRLILAAIRCSLMFTAVTTSLFCVRPAHAGYIVTLKQVGFDTVVATGSGALDLTGLTFQTGGFGGSLIDPFGGNIATGADAGTDLYGGAFTGLSNFGRGFQTFANSGTGNIVGMFFNGGGLNSFLLVPANYVSGTPLSDSATYNQATFVKLFVTPGTYVWTWGNGANQNFTLQIGPLGVPPPGVPDGGSTFPLLGCALLGLAVLRRKLPLLRGRKS